MRTIIENGIVIAWSDGRHRVLDPGVVVFEDDEITVVGGSYDGEADQTIDAAGRLVIPGLVNVHAHLTDTAFTKGIIEDIGKPNFTTLYRVLPAVRHATDPDAQTAAAACAFAELLRTGSTTVVELGFDYEIMGGGDTAVTESIAKIAGETGLRCYLGPRFRRGYYGENADGAVVYEDYPNAGRDRFEACIAFCREWDGAYDGRVRTMLAPGQVDTCDRDLLVETRRIADELKIPIQIHAGQSPTEFQRIREVHGKTTVEYMADAGLLGPDFIIGHGLWLTADGDVGTLPAHEAAALRDSGTTIAHLPWVKARQGAALNSLQKYLGAGIRVALGTDTYPFDMFNDMRFAAVCCKVVEESGAVAVAEDVFRIATVGGADALGRPDLGRLAPGAKADIVLVRTDTPKAAPLYDPLKFLVLAASGEDVDLVIVGGRTVVAQGAVLTVDVGEAVARLNEAGTRVRDRLEAPIC